MPLFKSLEPQLRIIKKVLIGVFIFSLIGCSGGETEGEDSDTGNPNPDDPSIHEDALAILKPRCASCHSAQDGREGRLNLESGSLDAFTQRLVLVPSESEDCFGEVLVNPENAEDSLLLKLVTPHNSEVNCIAKMPLGSNGVSAEEYATLKTWVQAIIDNYEDGDDFDVGEDGDDSSEFISSDIAVPADAFEVLSRTKYLLIGSAVTDEELLETTDDQGRLVQSNFENLVSQWVESDDFTAKRRSFFELALQQDPADKNYRQQLRNTGTRISAPTVANMKESLIRTAERVYKDRADFRSLFWTTRHEVTTAMLLVYKMLDNPPMRSKSGNFNKNSAINNLKAAAVNLIESDTNDWRTVELLYRPNSTEMQIHDGFIDGTNVSVLRSVPDGGNIKLRTPRTICTSPAFLQMWQTNADNKFRALVNQCLIITLGQTFTMGDPTIPENHPHPGIDTDQIPEGSDCMGCHKNLDPMKSAFEMHFDYEHHRFRPNSEESVAHYIEEAANYFGYDPKPNSPKYTLETFPSPYFSFQGVNTPGNDLFSLVESMAKHPDFAMGWTLKVCQWASSIKCFKQDPELVRIASVFSQSGYKLDKLFKEFFSSKMMTHTYSESENSFPGAQVSISRRDHFCQAMKVRLREVRRSRQLDDIDAFTDFCGKNINLARGIPKGTAQRGATGFTLPSSISSFSSISVKNLCSADLINIIGNNSRTFPRAASTATETISLMVEHILGYPKQTQRYTDANESLSQLYNVFKESSSICSTEAQFNDALSEEQPSCGLGLTDQAAMENIFTLACQNPSLTSLGI
ncbi:hypothetical protein [Pleionea sediminis]|uniref:hypothetical protein n=1 Tax=Pleionea sediminis TaxID=2569479 RepID=UPI001184F162|nr:hypothetical protein [Pleionea sediminis]